MTSSLLRKMNMVGALAVGVIVNAHLLSVAFTDPSARKTVFAILAFLATAIPYYAIASLVLSEKGLRKMAELLSGTRPRGGGRERS